MPEPRDTFGLTENLDDTAVCRAPGGNCINSGACNYSDSCIYKLPQAQTNSTEKATNPKDAVGIKKAPITTVSLAVIAEIGLAMMEGARKYGRHNYRVDGVRASVYLDATWRHLSKYWEGEDTDPDSGLSHITKALASLTVLRDAMINGLCEDDRPPKLPEGFLASLDKLAAGLIEKYPEPKQPFTEKNKNAN